ncbi:MAG: hypothetical protein DHS20C15_28870 [Planctomycetota bacterium]|nr:MAG: hypothetical protein DHS20C15_28870 [Planctomycetota bacterium]
MPRALRTPLWALAALLAFSPVASACPYCALSQGTDTLIFILFFLVIPYLVVTGVWIWMKRVLAAERRELAEQEQALESSEPAPRAR